MYRTSDFLGEYRDSGSRFGISCCFLRQGTFHLATETFLVKWKGTFSIERKNLVSNCNRAVSVLDQKPRAMVQKANRNSTD